MANSDSPTVLTNTLKVINDPIHGTIELHPFAELIMGNTRFQKLRHLKQLGMAYLVYPSATHSRFEHSVGTYFLAWQLAKTLQRGAAEREPEVQLSDDDVICVALAGLCHDLGHGPFSHLWEKLVQKTDKGYNHEEMSTRLFLKIVEEVSDAGTDAARNFTEFMRRHNHAIGQTNQYLIKELILGWPDEIPDDWEVQESRVVLYEKLKKRQFLFEIVNNKRTGFDVDKWDYINRDSHYIGLHSKFHCDRQLAQLQVLPCDGGCNLLTLRDKQMLEYVKLLISRRTNHYSCYQHIKVIGFELLISDALDAARSYVRSRVEAGEPVSERAKKYLLDECNSLDTLCWLTDERLVLLLSEDCGPVARQLMTRIVTRKSYKRLTSVGITLESDSAEDFAKYEAKIKQAKRAISDWNSCPQYKESEPRAGYSSVAVLRRLDYGAGKSHPLDKVYYYTKDNRETGQIFHKRNQLYSHMNLGKLHITLVRLYERTPLTGDWEERRKEEVKKFRQKLLDECQFEDWMEA